MLCAISGEAPQVPVISKKSGNVFEKRLIEAYIAENGTDPISKEELGLDDLIEVRSNIARSSAASPKTTSIPALLSSLQNEWDALALQTFTLRQQLAQTKQELSLALYQNDAAVRAIAKLTRERDEAREALSNVSINGGVARNGDVMQVDGSGLSDALIAKVQATQEALSKTRRKRPIPEDWASADTISQLKPKGIPTYTPANVKSLSSSSTNQEILVGLQSGNVDWFVAENGAAKDVLEIGDGPVTAVQFTDDSTAATGTASGSVHVRPVAGEHLNFSKHAGPVTALARHPSNSLLASTGVDKSFIFYDLDSGSVALQVFTNTALSAAAFHPDGHLFAAGGTDGQIKLFNVTDGSSAANFDSAGPIQSLSFSENGTWLASVSKGQTSVQIWDLRKAAQIKSLEIGGAVTDVAFDYTGQFLLATGEGGIAVQQYVKASKEWSEVLRLSVPAQKGVWGPHASSIFVVTKTGGLGQVA